MRAQALLPLSPHTKLQRQEQGGQVSQGPGSGTVSSHLLRTLWQYLRFKHPRSFQALQLDPLDAWAMDPEEPPQPSIVVRLPVVAVTDEHLTRCLHIPG